MRIKALILLIFTFLTQHADAQLIHLNEQTPYQNIGRQVIYYQDSSATLGLAEILKLDSAGRFERGKSDILNFGNTKSAFWLRVSYVQNTYEDVSIVVDVPNIEHIDCYILQKDGTTVHIPSGALSRDHRGVTVANNFVFKLPNPSLLTNPAKVYLRLKTNNYMLVPIKLATYQNIVSGQALRDRLENIYAGMLITLLLFNILMFISVKDRTYLYYSLYVFTLTGYLILYLRGYVFMLGDDIRILVNLHPHMFLSVSIIAGILFCRKFLNLDQNLPRVLKIFNILIGLGILMFLTSLLGYKALSAEISRYLTILVSLVLLGTGLFLYRRGHKPAKYYVIAWLSMGVTIIVVTLSTTGSLPTGDYTFELIPIGSAIELLLLSFALGDRYKSMIRNEKKVVALKASNEVKNKLFSIISHDLRSPLNSLMSILSLKDMDALTLDEIKYLLDENRKNIETIHNTLNNLLYWSKSQMDGIKTSPVAFDLKLLIDDLILVYMPLIQEKGIVSKLELAEAGMVYADKDQVKLIFRNLFDNAIKFTGKGQEMGCTLRSFKDRIEVCLYNQTSDTSGIFNHGGTGLGLQLCREYINSNGGELDISCREGSVYFCFELPVL